MISELKNSIQRSLFGDHAADKEPKITLGSRLTFSEKHCNHTVKRRCHQIMMSSLEEPFSKLNLRNEPPQNLENEPPQNLHLVVVASTFMSKGYECVITWSKERNKLFRPVANLKTNSWSLRTFQVGHKYKFEVVDLNPANAIWPHKSEDILVNADPTPDKGIETALYDSLFDLSKKSVTDVFNPGEIQEGRYIIEGMQCPSVGILRCQSSDIDIYREWQYNKEVIRCKIRGRYDFSVTAQNQETLIKMFPSKHKNDFPILVLLGSARPWYKYSPPRCYIMVIGITWANGKVMSKGKNNEETKELSSCFENPNL